MYNYTQIQGLDSREITSLPKIKNVMRTWRVISIIAENKPHSHNKTHLHTIKVYNTRPVSLIKILFFFRSLKCSVVPNSLTLSCDRIRGPTSSGKALNSIYYSFLSFLPKTCVTLVTQRFLFPVSTVSARNAWDPNALLCPKDEEKRLADESCSLRKRD